MKTNRREFSLLGAAAVAMAFSTSSPLSALAFDASQTVGREANYPGTAGSDALARPLVSGLSVMQEQCQEMLSLCLDKSINLGDPPLLDGLEGQPGCAVIEGPCDATPGSVLAFKLLRGVLPTLKQGSASQSDCTR
jgi:hypothetical protein